MTKWINELTPAINSPNARPSLPVLATPKVVSAGSQKLPGACILNAPSMKTTAIRNTIEMRPRTDV